MYGKSGVFPSEYVRPVAAPDFLVLPAERVEPRDRQGRVAASAAVAVAMGSAIAAHELDLSTEVQIRKLFHYITAVFFQKKTCPTKIYNAYFSLYSTSGKPSGPE